MHIHLFSIFTFLTLTTPSLGTAIPIPPSFPSTLIHQFPPSTWVENLALTPSNHLLLTLLTSPDLYILNPSSPSSRSSPPNLIHAFPTSHALLGLTSLNPNPSNPLSNYFLLLGNNFTLPTRSLALHSTTLYSLSLTHYNPYSNTGAVIKTIADLPDIAFSNGMATLSAERGLAIIADSIVGIIWLIDASTGSTRILLQAPELAPDSTKPGLQLGVNGVHVLHPRPRARGDSQPPTEAKNETYDIYFTNTSRGTLSRSSVTLSFPSSSPPSSPSFHTSLSTISITTTPITLIATVSPLGLDDFAIDESSGYIYLTCDQNQILRVPLPSEDGKGGGDGGALAKVEVVLGGVNSTVVVGPTSLVVAGGAGGRGKKMVYVSTNGGLTGVGPGRFVEGGEVLGVVV